MMRKLALGGLLAIGLMFLTTETASAQYYRHGGGYGGGYHGGYRPVVVSPGSWVNSGYGYGGYPGWYGRPVYNTVGVGFGYPGYGYGYPGYGYGGFGGYGYGRPAVGLGFNFVFR